MDFTSLPFYLALVPMAVAFYFVPARFRLLLLVIFSLGFYALAQLSYVPLLLISTALIYFCGLKIASHEEDHKKDIFLWLGVGTVLAMLIAFKALGAWHGFLLPLGISYYSFKLISYLVEVYWDDESVEKDFLYLLAYASFFPQIVSGPIQRAYDFLPQLREVVVRKADPEQIEHGFRLILGGLMLKLLIGDRLSRFIDTIDKTPQDYNFSILCLLTACYTLQLYADFAGYTNIALGVGKIFGIDGPKNFNAPFAAPNIQQMWQRWHMSLTSWLTDYLFTPLNMALRNLGKVGLSIAVAANMILIGIWHGFFLDYLLYGALHAFFILVTLFTKKWRDFLFGTGKILNAIRMTLGIIFTFILMSFSQIFFYLGDWKTTLFHLKLLSGYTPRGTFSVADVNSMILIQSTLCMIIAFYVGAGAPGFKPIQRKIDSFFPNWLQYGFCLLLLSALSIDKAVKFIYGQF
ncbi:MBOAT family protein [Acetobacteraceae bacterium]|nr:MBOAT family protein [Acetobacteraceae bacterium]